MAHNKLDDQTSTPLRWLIAGIVSTVGFTAVVVKFGIDIRHDLDALKVEVHLIGFDGSLYGQPLEVDFLARLRSIQPFASVEALKQQLHHDVAAAGRIAAESP